MQNEQKTFMEQKPFKLHSEYKPTGDQPAAIAELVKGFKEGNQFQTLLGVTGSGKTFTMANVIAALNKPTLVIAHNKTLAGQLYGEFKEFFPENAVEYFVSYYDYYQPEAYVPSSDTYIAKDSSINDEIEKLRLSATVSLTERRDVVVVASVSCIYGLGSPEEYQGMVVSLRPGMVKDITSYRARALETEPPEPLRYRVISLWGSSFWSQSSWRARDQNRLSFSSPVHSSSRLASISSKMVYASYPLLVSRMIRGVSIICAISVSLS